MNILGVTLARGGSKGVPYKHTKLLAGRPMIDYTFYSVMRSNHFSAYAVSSDDTNILGLADMYGFKTILRPPELALDTSPTLPALQHAVQEMELAYSCKYDYVVEVRATSPLKTSEDIDGAIELLLSSGADSVIGVTELGDHHPARAKKIVNGFIRDFCTPENPSGRRQDLTPKAYVRNGTIYAFKREALMGKDGKLFGHEDSRPYYMPEERSVNIDTPLDFALCEALICQK